MRERDARRLMIDVFRKCQPQFTGEEAYAESEGTVNAMLDALRLAADDYDFAVIDGEVWKVEGVVKAIGANYPTDDLPTYAQIRLIERSA